MDAVVEFLATAEDRARKTGDALLRIDPSTNRFVAERVSLTATCDALLLEMRSIREQLEKGGD